MSQGETTRPRPHGREPVHAPALLLTGRPGIGKTTVVQRIAVRLGDRAGGFYTREVRAGGRRIGFEIVTLDGARAWLAASAPDIALGRAVSLGRYRVDLEAIEGIAVPAMLAAVAAGQVVVVDEIGPMEIRSTRFCEAVLALLESHAPVVGTIVRRPLPFADRVRAHPRVRIAEVTRENRDRLADALLAALAVRGGE